MTGIEEAIDCNKAGLEQEKIQLSCDLGRNATVLVQGYLATHRSLGVLGVANMQRKQIA